MRVSTEKREIDFGDWIALVKEVNTLVRAEWVCFELLA
jgi:hypothetical protein